MSGEAPETPDTWRTIPSYRQRLVHLEGEIAAPASLVWDVLTNWGGLLTWFNAVPNPIYPLIAGDLLPGQSEDDLPRTRRCVFDTSRQRSEEHTSELQSLMRISYAVFCLKKKTKTN